MINYARLRQINFVAKLAMLLASLIRASNELVLTIYVFRIELHTIAEVTNGI